MVVTEKRCKRCGETKALEAFSPQRGCILGRRPVCNECRKPGHRAYFERVKDTTRDARLARGRAYYSANKAKVNARVMECNRAWRLAHPEEYRARKRANYANLRERVVAHLGGRCSCGFADPRALEIDHVNGGGTEELRHLVHETWYRQILRGTNPTPVRLLCATCNWRQRMSARTGRFPNATHIRLRREVVARLGARCPCGETDVDILQIDHVHGGGSVERRSTGRTTYYRRMLSAPPGTFQVLCPNCNAIKKRTNAVERPGPRR